MTDEEIFSRLIGSLYQAPYDSVQWHLFTQRLAIYYRGAVFMGVSDLSASNINFLTYAGLSETTIADYLTNHQHTSPYKPWVAGGYTGAVAVDTEISALDDAAYERTEFYNAFLKPNDLYWGFAAKPLKTQQFSTDMAILRSKRQGRIEQHETAIMKVMMPTLQLSLRVRRLCEAAGLGRGRLTHPRLGVMIVNHHRDLLFANESAEAIMAEGDALYLLRHRRYRLCALDVATEDRLEAMVMCAVAAASGAAIQAGGHLLLPRPPRRPLIATIAPLPATTDMFGPLDPAALLFLREPGAFRKPNILLAPPWAGIPPAMERE